MEKDGSALLLMLPPDLLLRTTTTCSWRLRGTRPSPTRSSSSRRLCVDSKRGKHVNSRHDAKSSQKLDNTHDDDDDAIYNTEHFVPFSCCWTTEVPPLLFWLNLAVGAIEDNTVWWILTVWSLSTLCRTNFLRLRSAVTVIQKVWRGYRCMRNYRTVSLFQLFLLCSLLQVTVVAVLFFFGNEFIFTVTPALTSRNLSTSVSDAVWLLAPSGRLQVAEILH